MSRRTQRDEAGLRALEQRLDHGFADIGLLYRAMCHRSWVAESDDVESNERLEFLGDAVLGWAVADLAFRQYPDASEGELTDLRKSVVNAVALAEVANELRLGEHLLLGRGEDAAGGREKGSILSDATEAVIGAVYIDGGPDAAFRLVRARFHRRLEEAFTTIDVLDHKSALQERTAQLGLGPPDYVVHASGPEHDKWFMVSVDIDGEFLGEGEGRTKKTAEQIAAGAAFDALADR
jgi:ribonuclease-3